MLTNTPTFENEVPTVLIDDVVVCSHPLLRDTTMIKRVGAFRLSKEGANLMVLYGDNRMCGESNLGQGLFGDVPLKSCRGRVVAVVAKP